ncbi:MAG: hypothetical protein VKP72_06050 [bacterium]|nr:hypothetical protein [bacterium]
MPDPRVSWLVVLALSSLACIASCGATSTGIEPPIVPAPSPVSPVDPGQAFPGSIAQVVARVQARRQVLSPFEAVLETREWKGAEFRGTKYRMLVQSSGLVKNTVVQSSTQFMTGMEMLVDGTDKVRIKLPGVLSFVTMTVSIQDERARSLNGFYPRQTDPSVFILGVSDPRARLTQASPIVFEGRVLPVVAFSRPDLPAGVTVAEAGIDMRTGDVVVGRLLAGNRLVYEYRMRNVVFRPIAPSEMTL